MITFKPGELADIIKTRVGAPCKIECEILKGPLNDTYNGIHYRCYVPGHPFIHPSGEDYWKVAVCDLRKRKPPKEELGSLDELEKITSWGDKAGYRPRVPTLTEIADNKEKVKEKV